MQFCKEPLLRSIMLRNKILFLSFLYLIAFLGNLNGQNIALDSLARVIETGKHDTIKINACVTIGDAYLSEDPDTALYFYSKALDIAIRAGVNTFPYCIKKSKALRKVGKKLIKQSQYTKALEILTESKKIDDDCGNYDEMAYTYIDIGNAYVGLGEMDKSIENYINALSILEKNGDKVGMADCYNNIGTALKEREYYQKAIDYHRQAATIFNELISESKPKDIDYLKRGLSYCFNNMGIIYYYLDSMDLALEHYTKSLIIKTELKDKAGMSQSLNNIAIVYCSQDNFLKGIEYFKKSLKINQEIGNQEGMAMVNGNISHLYLLLVETSETEDEKKNNLNNAVVFGRRAYELAESISSLPWKKESAGHLMNAYMGLGHYKEALKYADIFIKVQDQLFSTEKTTVLAEMTTRYEVEKKQLQIDNMEKEQELNAKTIRSQRIIIASVVLGFLGVIIFSVILFGLLKQKRLANSKLLEQKHEINQQKEEILVQLEEIESQRDRIQASKFEVEKLYQVAVEQKSILETQKRKIDDSIHYAQFIQSALLPDLDVIFVNRFYGIHSYFIMFRPKDIVSGDFYWATRVKEWLIVTVADCTGHGVPGAFMSMLGISFLNEIVMKGDVINPGLILGALRSYIISALKQTYSKKSQKDGMDMSIASINTRTKQCLWAGAHNPLWIFRSNNLATGMDMKYAFEEIKPNPMPVALHMHMEDFTEHEIQLYSGDRIFLFSDGYADQFGGVQGKKFGFRSGFKQLLFKTSSLPIKEQGIELEKAFDEWMGYGNNHHEQVDDVTVLGIVI